MPKVSILIPVYNSAKYLKATLNSVVNQTLDDVEVIIVNDGSTDKSSDIINEFSENYDFIKVYNQENKGVAEARNIALSHAKGEYIGFVDSDDEVDFKMYKEMYNLAISEDSDIVICGFQEIHSHFTIKNSGLFNNELNNKLLLPPSLCNKLIKRELFDDITFPNIMIGEDMVVVLKILNKTDKISYLNKYYYKYYKRQGSLMNQRKYNEYWNDIFIAFNILDMELENNKDELEYLFIQHVLRDSSIKFMYYGEGRESLAIINNLVKCKYPNFRKNQYYKKQKLKYRLVCSLLYRRQYFFVKLIRRMFNSDR